MRTHSMRGGAILAAAALFFIPGCGLEADDADSTEDGEGVGTSESSLETASCGNAKTFNAKIKLVYGKRAVNKSGVLKSEVKGIQIYANNADGHGGNKVFFAYEGVMTETRISNAVPDEKWTSVSFPSTTWKSVGEQIWFRVSFTKKLQPDVSCSARITVE